GVAAHEIGFDTLLMYTWKDREKVMDLLANLGGNRVNYGIHTLGGVRRDISPEQVQLIVKTMDMLEERTKYYREVASEEKTVIERLSGAGRLTLEDVRKLGVVGPTARASGLMFDIRRDDAYECYGEIAFDVITDTHCDVYGRTLVRIGELLQSYSIIRHLATNLPDGPISMKFPRRVPAGEAVARCEAPRGEDIHYVKSNGTDKPERVHVRAPTMANLQAVPKMLESNYLADVPIVLAAIDPCFSCTDRMILLKEDPDSKGKIIAWGELREFSLNWYKKERGLDLSTLRLKKDVSISLCS
ncbi:MAG: NADH dehydrogenase subunit, partial [SAR324 cluster bacterium]|nr:NADH dehydrogenase subunit [SAR324 cluster bacterium]